MRRDFFSIFAAFFLCYFFTVGGPTVALAQSIRCDRDPIERFLGGPPGPVDLPNRFKIAECRIDNLITESPAQALQRAQDDLSNCISTARSSCEEANGIFSIRSDAQIQLKLNNDSCVQAFANQDYACDYGRYPPEQCPSPESSLTTSLSPNAGEMSSFYLEPPSPEGTPLPSPRDWTVSTEESNETPTPEYSDSTTDFPSETPQETPTPFEIAAEPTPTETPEPLTIQIEGHAEVKVPCNTGDWECQAHYVCEAVTGFECIRQDYDCATESSGSWYPLDGRSGGSSFNFAVSYDLMGNYGNICACDSNQLRAYGLAGGRDYCGSGVWYRDGVSPQSAPTPSETAQETSSSSEIDDDQGWDADIPEETLPPEIYPPERGPSQ